MSRLLPYDTFTHTDHSLIELAPEAFAALTRDGTVGGVSTPAELALAWDAVWVTLEFLDDPAGALDALLDHSWLVRPRADGQPGLDAAGPGPLRQVLQDHLARWPASRKRPDLVDWLRRSDKPLRTECRDELKRSGVLYGHLGTCICGETGCGAVFGWAAQSMGVLLVETGGSRFYISVLADPEAP